jgi:hypothetical protein
MKEFLKFAIKEKYAQLDGTNDPQQRKEIARLWRRLRSTR